MSEDTNIPEMNPDKNYSEKKPIIENNEKDKKEMEKTKDKLEKLKSYIVKKYNFTQAIGILPPQSIKNFIDEEDVPKETDKHIHLLVIIPEEKIKEIPKIKQDLVAYINTNIKQKIWLHIKTPVDIWELCLDSKFDLVSAVSMAFPLYDKGILGALRITEIHKSLVLQKFERYVVSYVIAGSLVRGTAVKTSDVDVFIIINDTDVKRMPRLELKEKLRAIIYQYVSEAAALAGVKVNLSPQIYLLTDFWESVKDAHPVIFTFIRDGVPIYDRGTFMPWKALLKMGKLKPSPEAIDMFMSMGDKTIDRVKRTLLDVVIQDIYWGVLTPSQALLMLYGLPPPTPKQTAAEMEKIFVEKEKMLEKKYITILEKIVGIYKDYEHEKIKEIKGDEVDKLISDSEAYLKRLKELREQIEKSAQEKTIDQIYQDVIGLMKAIFGNKSQALLTADFEKQLIKTGKFPQQHLTILNEIIHAKAELKRSKLDIHKTEQARKNASILINGLVEYSQRCDLVAFEKGKMKIKFKENNEDKFAELVLSSKNVFFIKDGIIKKVTDKIQDSSVEEFSKSIEEQRGKKTIGFSPRIFDVLKKEIGEFEIAL